MFEQLHDGSLYFPMAGEILDVQNRCLEKLYDYNHTRPSENERRVALLREMFCEIGENCYIEPPFHANWGGKNIHFGSDIYLNSNCTLVDDGHIYIGDHVLIGPNVTIATANHPQEPELRVKGLQYNRDVRIGENTWLGAGVIIVPGVNIGKNVVIGAGSVVVKDIPDNTLAVGNPCRVIRDIGPKDN